MRQGIVGGLTGGVVAVGISLLAQTWTTPRTWVTAEVVTAGQFNTHVRDNLTHLYTRIDTVLGTDGRITGPLSDTILSDLSGANLTGLTASQITSGTFGQNRLAADSVGTSQLRTAQGSADGPVGQGGGRRNATSIDVNRYTLLPVLTGQCGRVALRLDRSASSTDAPKVNIVETGVLTCAGGTFNMTLYWDYVTSSDTPTVWVVIGGTGDVYATWESEDPAGTDSPFGELETGQRAVAIGLPSLAQLEALYAALTTAQQAAALDTLRATVVTRRGWLSSLTALSDLAGIETRYEPSGRHWALRALADTLDRSVGAYVATRMAVDTATDAWTVRATPLTTRPVPGG